MKQSVPYLIGIVLLASCSAPKMAYKFDYHDYNAGARAKEIRKEVASNPGPVAADQNELVASAKEESIIVTDENQPAVVTNEVQASRSFNDLSKSERRELKKQIKHELKKAKKDNIQNTQSPKGLDQDLKLAAIFGAVGIVGLIIGGNVFYIIGGLALIIGVVFFVKWLIRQ